MSQSKIMELFKKHPDKWYSAPEVKEIIGTNNVFRQLQSLCKFKMLTRKIEKSKVRNSPLNYYRWNG